MKKQYRIKGRFATKEQFKDYQKKQQKKEVYRIKGRFATKEQFKNFQNSLKLSKIAGERLRINGRFLSVSQENFIKNLVVSSFGVADKKTAQDFINRNKKEIQNYIKTEVLVTEHGDQKTFELLENYIDTGKKVTVIFKGKEYRGFNALLKLAQFSHENSMKEGYYYTVFSVQLKGEDELFLDIDKDADVIFKI